MRKREEGEENKLAKMAEKMAADLSVNKIVLLQAVVRGFLVRRKLLEVRKEFEEVLNELDTDTNFVFWKKEALGLPFISRDPKVLTSINEQKKSGCKENEDEAKQSGSVKEEFGVKLFSADEELETMLNTEDCERADGEKSVVDEGLVLESPASGASNSESCDKLKLCDLHMNQAFRLENNTISKQGHRQPEEMICPREQSSEKQRSLIQNSEITNQCGFPDERFPHRVPDSPLPLNSTLKSGLRDEQETRESVGRDSTSETSLQSDLQGRPHLREQAHLSDTWLTDRSFDTVVADEESIKGLPTDPVKLRQLRDHIGMELLWTEQAIQSRKKLGFKLGPTAIVMSIQECSTKKYLGLKKGLAQADQDDQTINWE